MSVKAAAPMATSTLVLSPAVRWRYCRSSPISVPSAKATASRMKLSAKGGRSVGSKIVIAAFTIVIATSYGPDRGPYTIACAGTRQVARFLVVKKMK